MSEAAPIQSALSFADEAEGIAFFRKLGLDCAAKVAGLAGEMEGHFAKLGRHEAEYAGDFGHRLSGGATDRDLRGAVRESIFGQSNLSLNIPRGQCRYLTAKSTEDLLGSRPWLAASGLGSPPSMWRREIGVRGVLLGAKGRLSLAWTWLGRGKGRGGRKWGGTGRWGGQSAFAGMELEVS